MNREDILEKSRAENKNKDIYEQEVLKRGWEISVLAMVILAGVFFAVQIFVGGGTNYGLWAIVFSGQMVTFWVKWSKLKRRHELALALSYTVVVIGASAAHIYNLITLSTIL